jgi:hypothetical protein
LCLFLGLSAVGFPARADMNLSFDSSLTGWTSSDASLVSASNGQATITESSSSMETDLYQTFTVPSGAQSLQFTLVSIFADSPPAIPRDAFGASLLDPITGTTLVSTVPTDPTSDSFYTRDVVQDVVTPSLAAGVSESPVPGTQELVVSLDISSLAAGQQAEILFRLIGGDDLSSSTVTLSDVGVLTSPTQAVPEPSTFFVAGLGILGWLGYALRPRAPARVTSGPGAG